MKKKLFMTLVCVILLLSGCAKENAAEGDKVKEDYKQSTESETIKKETEINTTTKVSTAKVEKNPNLAYVEGIRDRYAKILADEKYILEVLDTINKDDNYYEISIRDKRQIETSLFGNGKVCDIWIYESDEGVLRKNFHTVFFNKKDNTIIKEFIKVTLLAMDSEIDETLADEKVKQMIESTANSSRSEIVNAGEYHIFYEDEGGDLTVYAIHENELNKKVNKDEYKSYTVEEMKASLNWDEKAYITVTPYTNGSPVGEVMQFQAKSDEGDEYIIYYNFNSYLKDFDLGKKYTLYGVILKPHGDTLRFRADYYEE